MELILVCPGAILVVIGAIKAFVFPYIKDGWAILILGIGLLVLGAIN